MKFYNKQHEFYCGIDLHANSMHVCVVDQGGNKLLHRNFNTKKPERFLIALQPFDKHDLELLSNVVFWLIELGGDFLLNDSVFEGPSFDDERYFFVAVEPPPFL